VAAPRILVVGSINVDIVALTERLPTPGETVTGGTLLINHGGKGANQAVAARRLGADVRFIGCVGDDTFGPELRQSMTAEGIGVQGLATSAGINALSTRF
jgi:ribokinase